MEMGYEEVQIVWSRVEAADEVARCQAGWLAVRKRSGQSCRSKHAQTRKEPMRGARDATCTHLLYCMHACLPSPALYQSINPSL